jgi:LysR family transcriptional regulator, hydrogen peroxide-inducible genes activator
VRYNSYAFTLRQLQYALAVAETRSFRRAAERCHVSQPALSAQLAQLESALGVTLFERDRRRVLVTAAGGELLERARRILLATDDLVEVAKGIGDPLSGTLRLGIIPTISPYLLPTIAPALRAAHPQLTVQWVEDKTPTLAEDLAHGRIDAALVALEAELGEVDHAVVASDPFVLAVSSSHPLARSGRPAHAEDLRGARVLLLDDGHCFREQALQVCHDAGAEELGFRATSLGTLAQMVASDGGVTLLPRLAVPTEARRGTLSLRRFAKPAPRRTLALIWRRSSPLVASLRALAGTIRDAYEALEPELEAACVEATAGTRRATRR